MLKKIISVIVGYAIFVVSSLALFQLSGQNAHAEATLNFQLITLVYGAFFSFLSGLVVQLIAKPKNLYLNYILAFILAGFATFSLFKAEGNHWTQLMAIVIFAPTSILGGLYYLRSKK